MSGEDPVEAVLAPALHWLDEHSEWWRPAVWTRHLHPLPVEAQTLIEGLLLARRLRRSEHRESHETAARLEGVAAEEAVELLAGDALGRLDDQTVYRLWLVALLGEHAPEALRRRAGETFAACGAATVRLDAPATVTLEAAYVGRLGRWAPTLPRFADLRPGGYLDLDVGLVDEPQLYALTHDLMYETDLGAEPLRTGPGVADGLRDVVETLLGRMLVAGHWDLAAELLVCATALGSTRLRELTARILGEAQLPSGATPGPDHDVEVAGSRSGEHATAYEVRTCYHATLVTAMALVPVGAGPVGAAGVDAVAEPAHRLLVPGRAAAALAEGDLEAAAAEVALLPPGHPAVAALRRRRVFAASGLGEVL